MTDVSGVGGQVLPAFGRVADAFAQNLSESGEIGAACSVYVDGELAVDLWGGLADAETGTSCGDQTIVRERPRIRHGVNRRDLCRPEAAASTRPAWRRWQAAGSLTLAPSPRRSRHIQTALTRSFLRQPGSASASAWPLRPTLSWEFRLLGIPDWAGRWRSAMLITASGIALFVGTDGEFHPASVLVRQCVAK